jgi:heptosyltransferase-2
MNVQAESIKRVVVRGTNWVGDSVMTVPALRALRRVLPEAHITLVIRPGAKGIFSETDFIDDVLVYDRNGPLSVLGQVREWKRRQFDLAVLFQNAFEAALIPFLAGVPLRLGYATESRQPLLTHPLALPDWRSSKHEVFYYLYLVTALEQMLFGRSDVCESEPDASIRISESRKAAAVELLRAYGVGAAEPVVAICPGSINSRAKRWPAERFAALADRLIESQRKVLLIGSKDEIDVSDDVVRQMRNRPVMLTGKTSLDQIIAVLDRADLIVTNDTGPAHIGAALGRPTIVIFGPTNPLTTRPFAPEANVLREPPDCAPCMLRDCPIDHRCMTAITVDVVFERSHALLKRGSFARTVRSLCDSVV